MISLMLMIDTCRRGKVRIIDDLLASLKGQVSDHRSRHRRAVGQPRSETGGFVEMIDVNGAYVPNESVCFGIAPYLSSL